MAQPSPDPVASYWGVDPTLPAPENVGQVPAYWAGDAVAPTVPGPVAAGGAYQPNPGAPGFNPNPGTAPAQVGAVLGAGPAVAPSQQGMLGRAGAAVAQSFSSPDPVFQNPFASKPSGPAPIDMGELDGVVDIGEIDARPAATSRASIPTGPTAEDDAALAAFNAKLTAPKPAPARGGTSNPDPYGIGAAQKAQLGAMDARMGAMNRAANAEQYRDLQRAEHNANLSRMQQEDAAIAHSEQEYAAKLFNEQMTELGRQLDDVKTRKVDPLKDFKESPALGVLAIVGGAIGGLYQGLTGGKSNEFIDDLNRHVDRGIAEQERQIRDEKWTIGEGMNMLHQQRQAQKDDALAAAQLRNVTYEAVKNEIAAEADRDGTAIGRANADAAISVVQGQQAELQRQIGEQKRAQAMAAAAAAHAQRKEVQTAIFNQYDKNLASGMSPGQAVDWAQYMVGQVYAPGHGPGRPASSVGAGADPVMSVPKDLRAEAGKELSEYSKIEGGVKAVNEAFEKYKRTGVTDPSQRAALRATLAGIYKTSLGPGMSSDSDFERFIEPNIPKTGQLDDTIRLQQQNIASVLRSKAATPILDAHAKGWRQPSQADVATSLGAKPVGR